MTNSTILAAAIISASAALPAGEPVAPESTLVKAAATPERTQAAIDAEFKSQVYFAQVPTFDFARSTVTGALYIRAHGVWLFLRDEGARDQDGARVDIAWQERGYAKLSA